MIASYISFCLAYESEQPGFILKSSLAVVCPAWLVQSVYYHISAANYAELPLLIKKRRTEHDFTQKSC